jgi:hypothetical protein
MATPCGETYINTVIQKSNATFFAYACTIFGDGNKISGDDNVIIGDGNRCDGDGNKDSGHGNDMHGVNNTPLLNIIGDIDQYVNRVSNFESVEDVIKSIENEPQIFTRVEIPSAKNKLDIKIKRNRIDNSKNRGSRAVTFKDKDILNKGRNRQTSIQESGLNKYRHRQTSTQENKAHSNLSNYIRSSLSNVTNGLGMEIESLADIRNSLSIFANSVNPPLHISSPTSVGPSKSKDNDLIIDARIANASPKPTTDKETCSICHSHKIEVILRPCYHFTLCPECARALIKQKEVKCPLCRGQVKEMILTVPS